MDKRGLGGKPDERPDERPFKMIKDEKRAKLSRTGLWGETKREGTKFFMNSQ